MSAIYVLVDQIEVDDDYDIHREIDKVIVYNGGTENEKGKVFYQKEFIGWIYSEGLKTIRDHRPSIISISFADFTRSL
jgi:hypothetical protein